MRKGGGCGSNRNDIKERVKKPWGNFIMIPFIYDMSTTDKPIDGKEINGCLGMGKLEGLGMMMGAGLFGGKKMF